MKEHVNEMMHETESISGHILYIYIYMILTVNCVYTPNTVFVLLMCLFIFNSTYILSDSSHTHTHSPPATRGPHTEEVQLLTEQNILF